MKNIHTAIKCRILNDIKNLFGHEEEDYYKSVKVNDIWNKNQVESKSKGDKKTLSVNRYLNKIRPYLKYIINNLKKSGTCKFQFTVTVNYISSIDNDKDFDRERVMHPNCDNIEIKINN